MCPRHLLLERFGHSRAVVALELVAAADDRGPAEAPTVWLLAFPVSAAAR